MGDKARSDPLAVNSLYWRMFWRGYNAAVAANSIIHGHPVLAGIVVTCQVVMEWLWWKTNEKHRA